MSRDEKLTMLLRMVDVHSFVVSFLNSLSYDHIALLDIIMYEETPFLLDYLQLVVDDWEGLCEACSSVGGVSVNDSVDNISEGQEEKLLSQDAVESSSGRDCEEDSEEGCLVAEYQSDEDITTKQVKRIKLAVDEDWSSGHSSPQGCPEKMKTLDSVIGVFIRLKYALLRLNSKSLIPPGLCQLIPLLECVENIYEVV